MNPTLKRITQLNKALILGIAAFLGVMLIIALLIIGASRAFGVFGVTDPVLVLGLLGVLGLVLVIGFFYYSFNRL